MIAGLHLAALVLYGVAAVLMGVSFARGGRRLPAVASGVLGGGLVVHTWALALFTGHWQELPLVGLGPSLSTFAYLVGIGTLIASTVGQALGVGLVLIPVVVLLVGAAAGVGMTPAGEPVAFQGIWFALHVFFAFIGYAGLTVAFAAGLMYLLQFRELKSKHFGAIFRFFPPLDTLDRLGRQGLLIGFPFLTLAMLAGWAWTVRFRPTPQVEGGKLIWVFVSWAVFVAALLARTGRGRRGERGALVSVIGFVLVVAFYLVVRVQTSRGGTFL
jgi:ABC-type uncharacterized transport system permease subunit